MYSSGHAKVHDLIRLIHEINPEKLIPIHTNYPKLFEKIFKIENMKIIFPTIEVHIHI
ncbi:MAG: MBL fold metallo-hydrolase RNA specificity domain-containing protein [Candidatus Thorarchaeota archaeon]